MDFSDESQSAIISFYRAADSFGRTEPIRERIRFDDGHSSVELPTNPDFGNFLTMVVHNVSEGNKTYSLERAEQKVRKGIQMPKAVSFPHEHKKESRFRKVQSLLIMYRKANR
jgi:hypothetical protein